MIGLAQILFVVSVFVGALSQRVERGFAAPEYQTEYNNNYRPNPAAHIPILRMEIVNNGEAGFTYAYETGNKISSQQQGDPSKTQGSYSYTAPDGQQVSMSYVADENGFRPTGSHIPVGPPMPELIKRAVEQNLAEEARGIVDDGSYRENTHEGIQAPALPPHFRV